MKVGRLQSLATQLNLPLVRHSRLPPSFPRRACPRLDRGRESTNSTLGALQSPGRHCESKNFAIVLSLKAGRLQNLRGRSKKGRKVRDGSVRIRKRRNLSSSAWSRRRTPGRPGECAIPFRQSPVFTRAGSAAHPAGPGLRSDHHGPHRPVRQDALAGAEGASGVSSGASAPRHRHFAHPGWGYPMSSCRGP